MNFVEKIARYILVILVSGLRCFVDPICLVEVGALADVEC